MSAPFPPRDQSILHPGEGTSKMSHIIHEPNRDIYSKMSVFRSKLPATACPPPAFALYAPGEHPITA